MNIRTDVIRVCTFFVFEKNYAITISDSNTSCYDGVLSAFFYLLLLIIFYSSLEVPILVAHCCFHRTDRTTWTG
jgi:hypothetical protein